MSGALALPLACFVGLAIGGAEVTVAGYTRQPTTLMYCEDGVTIANLASIQWPRALASWGTIDEVLLQTAATGGAPLGTLPALVPLAIRQYDIARIPAGGIAVVQVPTTRTFGTGTFGVSVYGAYRGFEAVGAMPAGFGMGGFGMFGYATTGGVPLQRAFDNQHACEPGIWAPGPFAAAA